jgi:hypothetical protein
MEATKFKVGERNYATVPMMVNEYDTQEISSISSVNNSQLTHISK